MKSRKMAFWKLSLKLLFLDNLEIYLFSQSYLMDNFEAHVLYFNIQVRPLAYFLQSTVSHTKESFTLKTSQ